MNRLKAAFERLTEDFCRTGDSQIWLALKYIAEEIKNGH